MNDEHIRPFREMFHNMAQEAKATGAAAIACVFMTPIESNDKGVMFALHIEFVGAEGMTKDAYAAALATAAKIVENGEGEFVPAFTQNN